MVRKNRTLLTYLGFFICGVGLVSATSVFATNNNIHLRWGAFVVGVLQAGLCGYIYRSERQRSQQVEPENIELKIIQP